MNDETATTDDFIISGLKASLEVADVAAAIDINGTEITIKNAGLLTDGATIAATNDYTAKLADALAPSDAISKGWDGNDYYAAAGYKQAGWTLDASGKVTKVKVATPAVTISGLKDGVTLNNDNITVGTNKITILDSALLTNGATITADNEYAIELATSLAPRLAPTAKLYKLRRLKLSSALKTFRVVRLSTMTQSKSATVKLSLRVLI